jgi:hypothetical protein
MNLCCTIPRFKCLYHIIKHALMEQLSFSAIDNDWFSYSGAEYSRRPCVIIPIYSCSHCEQLIFGAPTDHRFSGEDSRWPRLFVSTCSCSHCEQLRFNAVTDMGLVVNTLDGHVYLFRFVAVHTVNR